MEPGYVPLLKGKLWLRKEYFTKLKQVGKPLRNTSKNTPETINLGNRCVTCGWRWGRGAGGGDFPFPAGPHLVITFNHIWKDPHLFLFLPR